MEDVVSRFDINNDWYVCGYSCSNLDHLCGGYYQDPSLLSELTTRPNGDKLIIKSDYTKFIAKGMSSFSGNVVVTNKNQQLLADQLLVKQNLDAKLESLQVKGKVRLLEPGLRIIGEDLRASLREPDYKKINNANYRFYAKHATGDATDIEIFADQKIHMSNATYTTCSPRQQTWRLGADKIILDKNSGRGEAFQAKFYLYQQPIFYLPYISFPLDKKRHTGFMLPSVDDSSKHGFTVTVPWYWNIASNYDYMITPIFMHKRGLKLNNDFRYLNKYSLGRLKYDFILTDKHYLNWIKKHKNNSNSPLDSNDLRYKHLKNNHLRYGFWYKNITKIYDGWNLYLNYNKVSDSNYMKDFGQHLGKISFFNLAKSTKSADVNLIPNYVGGITSAEEVLHDNSLHLPQSVKLEHTNAHGILHINFSQYQTLYPLGNLAIQEQFKKFPELNWQANDIKLSQQCYFKYNLNYTDFRLRSLNYLDNRLIGKRVNFRPSLEYLILSNYSYLKPRIQLDILKYYDLSTYSKVMPHGFSRQQSRIMPIIDFKSGMYFTRKLNHNLRQTLEPHIYYLYVPLIQQQRYPNFDSKFIEYSYRQLFLDNRYTGIDRISDAHQLAFGVKISIRGSDGGEKINFAIARARYFKKPTAHLNENLNFNHWSPIAMLLGYNFNCKFSLEADLILEKISKVRNTSLYGQYKFTPDKIINLGYQYAKFNALSNHQLQISSFWNMKKNLNLLGKVDYDLSQKRLSYALMGVEVDNCCIGLRFAMSRSYLTNRTADQIKYNNKFLAQIIFKGFTALGSLDDNCLIERVPKSKF